MELDCEGCAGCCLDWRPLAPDAAPERRSRRPPLDDAYNLVPCTRDEVRTFLDAGLGDALVPRLFEPADGDDRVTVDGRELAAVDGRPVFMIGLRKVPKPVAPFGREGAAWLPTCAFLDPTTLQCRIHGEDLYPDTCAAYPGHNLALDATAECERVEDAFGGDRLLDEEPPEDLPPPQFGPQALGATVFAFPDPGELAGVVERLTTGDLTAPDRAPFVGAAVGSRPGTLDVDRDRMSVAAERVREADSWVGRAAAAWAEHADESGSDGDLDSEAVGAVVREIETAGAPTTPGWATTPERED